MESSNINITAYRAQAEKYSRQSELTSDAESKLHFLAMAQGWLKLADNLGKRDVYTISSMMLWSPSEDRLQREPHKVEMSAPTQSSLTASRSMNWLPMRSNTGLFQMQLARF